MYKYTNFSDDRSCVCLKGAPGVDSCDYINASFIDVSINNTSSNLSIYNSFHYIIQGYGGRKNAYIAAQGNKHVQRDITVPYDTAYSA